MMIRGRGLTMGALVAASALALAACSSSDDTSSGASPSDGTTSGAVTINGSQPQNPLVPVLTNETGGGNIIDGHLHAPGRLQPEDRGP